MALHELNGVRLLVEESGRGDPVVLVHGSWDDHTTWAMVEPDLSRRFRVVSYDRRGHTGSEDGAGSGIRRDDEDDLAALIEWAGAPAHVVGNSFGGSIALGLAARRPELFRTLAVHEPPLTSLAADDPVVVRAGEAIGHVIETIQRGDDEAAAKSFAENVALGPGAWDAMPPGERAKMTGNAGTFPEEMMDPESAVIDLEGLRAVDFPVLLTQGDQSPPFFSRIIAQLGEAVSGSEIVTIAGAGHVPHVTHPHEYVAELTRIAGAGAG